MFALLGAVCFLRQRCAPNGSFPCGSALGSHLVPFHFDYLTLESAILQRSESTASWCLSLLLAEEKIAEPALAAGSLRDSRPEAAAPKRRQLGTPAGRRRSCVVERVVLQLVGFERLAHGGK
jgi:hypothetical protein